MNSNFIDRRNVKVGTIYFVTCSYDIYPIVQIVLILEQRNESVIYLNLLTQRKCFCASFNVQFWCL